MTTITLEAITRPGQDMPVRATCLEIKTKNISEHELTVKKNEIGGEQGVASVASKCRSVWHNHVKKETPDTQNEK